MEKKGKPNQERYTTIPDVLLEKEGLSLNAKVIFGKILNLSRSCKEVKISNERLSQLISSDIRTVQRAKKELRELGLISIVQDDKGRGNLATVQVNKMRTNAFLGFQYFQLVEKKDDIVPEGECEYKKVKVV